MDMKEAWGSSAVSVQGLDSDDGDDLEDEGAPQWRFGVDKCLVAPPVPAAPALLAVACDSLDSNLEPDPPHPPAPPVEESQGNADAQPSDYPVDNVAATNRFDSHCSLRFCLNLEPWMTH